MYLEKETETDLLFSWLDFFLYKKYNDHTPYASLLHPVVRLCQNSKFQLKLTTGW